LPIRASYRPFAAAILSSGRPAIGDALDRYRERQTAGVLARPDPRQG
jgi:hypothetical protein